MILDDLFNLAAQQFQSGQVPAVEIEAGVTTNQTGGLQTQTNTAAAETVALAYHPRRVVEGPVGPGILPPAFVSGGLNITAYPVNHYVIEWQGTSFTANVDPATNIVFGVAGQEFVTISLCRFTSVLSG